MDVPKHPNNPKKDRKLIQGIMPKVLRNLDMSIQANYFEKKIIACSKTQNEFKNTNGANIPSKYFKPSQTILKQINVHLPAGASRFLRALLPEEGLEL